jgi:hypothetical protein
LGPVPIIVENISPTMSVPAGTKMVSVTRYVPASNTERQVSGYEA